MLLPYCLLSDGEISDGDKNYTAVTGREIKVPHLSLEVKQHSASYKQFQNFYFPLQR